MRKVDTVEAINELAVSVDADMKAQREAIARRQAFAITVEDVQRIARCPDWPDERVVAYATLRERWYLADVIGDAFAARLPLHDAVWLLLWSDKLRREQLVEFVCGCTHAAMGYARDRDIPYTVFTVDGNDWACSYGHFRAPPVVPAETREPAVWAAAQPIYKTVAALTDVPSASSRDRQTATTLVRCSRLVGLVLQTLVDVQPARTVHELHQIAASAASLAARCSHGPQKERHRQLVHLLQFVT